MTFQRRVTTGLIRDGGTASLVGGPARSAVRAGELGRKESHYYPELPASVAASIGFTAAQRIRSEIHDGLRGVRSGL